MNNQNIRRMSDYDLLKDFETRVRCNHYCPVECTHETEFNADQLYVEIIRRMSRCMME